MLLGLQFQATIQQDQTFRVEIYRYGFFEAATDIGHSWADYRYFQNV